MHSIGETKRSGKRGDGKRVKALETLIARVLAFEHPFLMCHCGKRKNGTG
jgi:hypothetical protein